MASTEDEVVVRLRLADVRKFIEDTKSGERAIKDLDATVEKAGKTARIQAGPSGGLGALPALMRGIVTWGARGTAALASAGVGVAVYAVKSAASLEQVTVAFTTLLHSAGAAKAMVASLQTFAQTTPFELSGVEQTAQRLLAFGFAAKSVVPMMTAIGNAASGMNLGQGGMDEIALVLGQMKALSRIQGGDLLQLAQHGINGYGILEKGLGLTPAAFSKAMQAGKISAAKGIPILLKGMQDQFRGMMDKESHTLGGIASNFHDAIQQGLIKLANPFLPTMKGWLQGATTYLGGPDGKSGLFGRASLLAPDLGHAIARGDAGTFSAGVGNILGTHALDPAVEKTFTVVKNLGVIVRDVLVPAGKDLAVVLAPVVLVLEHLDQITGFVADHSSAFHRVVVVVVVALIAYRVAVLTINTTLRTFATIQGLVNVLKGEEVAATNGQKVAWYGYRAAVLAGRGVLLLVKAVNMAAWWLAQRAGLLAYKTAQVAINAAQRVWIEMKFWGVIAKVGAQWVIQKGALLAYKGAQLAVNAASKAWTEMRLWAQIAKVVAQWVIQKGALLAYKGAQLAVSAATKAWAAAQWLLNVAMDANPIGLVVIGIAALIAVVVLAYNKVGWFRNAVNVAAAWIVKAFGKVIAFFKAAPGVIAGVGKTMWNGITDGFKAAVNWIIDKWNWLADHMPSINIPGIGSVGGLPHIPHLATGGTAIQSGSALVGERGPEVVTLPRGASVIPLPRDRAVTDGELGDRVTVVQIDGKEIMRAVHRYQDDRMARR